MYLTKRVLCVFKHDNTLSLVTVALFVSGFTKEALSSRFGRRRRLPFSSASRLIRGNRTLNTTLDEAERRVSDNAGYDGAYYRIMRPAFNNTYGIRLHARSRSILHFNQSLVRSHFSFPRPLYPNYYPVYFLL